MHALCIDASPSSGRRSRGSSLHLYHRMSYCTDRIARAFCLHIKNNSLVDTCPCIIDLPSILLANDRGSSFLCDRSLSTIVGMLCLFCCRFNNDCNVADATAASVSVDRLVSIGCF